MMILNLDTQKYLAGYSMEAADPVNRTRGMIGRRFVCGKFDALVFKRCSSVHTCFMAYPLDLVFLDKADRVVSIYKKARPWRVFFGGRGAVSVVELPPGAIDFSGTLPGHNIDLECKERIDKFSSEAILLSDR